MFQTIREDKMAEPSALKTRAIRSDGPINDVALKGMTPAVETIQSFAREIAQMSGQVLDRTTRRIEKLRKAQSMEVAASVQAYFFERVYGTCGPTQKKVRRNAGELPARAGAAGKRDGRDGRGGRHAAAAKVERLSGVAPRT
jgi:hypothetical protein